MPQEYHRIRKPINESFFDEESEKIDYIVGASYSCYTNFNGYKRRNQLIFRSRHKKLVELVRDEVFPAHSITSDNRKGKSSHWIAVASPQRMYSKLEEIGLNIPKKEREFPKDIPENRLYNVVRGFLDAEAETNAGKNYMRIGFHNRFLSGLNKVLIKYAGVKGGILKDNELIYKKDDAIKIYNFTYQNFGFIKKQGLHLPEKKEAFYKCITKKPKVNYKNLKRRREKIKRVEQAKKLLEEGLSVEETSKKVGYAYSTRFCSVFKEVIGCTPTEYKREVKEKKRTREN